MNLKQAEEWFARHRVVDVDLLVPDMAGATRGKSMNPSIFMDSVAQESLRVPEVMYAIAAQGETVHSEFVKIVERDLVLKPDLSTLHLAPWNREPTACAICDSYYDDGKPNNIAPRQVLKNVVALYEEKGWTPIVGPEIEFYLIEKFKDVIFEPRAPDGQSGLREFGQHVYSLDAIDEFAHLFEELYQFSEVQRINLETIIHEDGPCQFEVNIRHSSALEVADQLYLFKRLSRQTAMRHNMFITFMAKPYADQSGSAIHLHQSVVDKKTGANIFADDTGEDSELFMNYIGGLQTYLPIVMPLMAPYANSYRRFEAFMSAPTNTNWGRENRTVGLRVPKSRREARRVENRIAGSDVNPYLAISASLLAGYIGMVEKISPRPEHIGDSYHSEEHPLPRHLNEALDNFATSEAMAKYLGAEFVDLFTTIKMTENEHRSSILNPWDVRFLMVNV